MKSQKGITLTSLVIYIIVMLISIGVISFIVSNFYKNIDRMDADTEDILEFNKFNTYFLKEIKLIGNSLDRISDNYILFTSGNSFSLSDNKIYYNSLAICDGVETFFVQTGKNGDGINNNIIYVTINFENFTKSINYKIEEIY